MKPLSILQRYWRGMPSHWPQIDLDTFHLIIYSFDMFQFNGPLLPNLHEIFCDNTVNSLRNIYHLIPSKLQLQLFQMYMDHSHTPGPIVMTIFSSIQANSPHIEYFSIFYSHIFSEALAPCISNAICGLQCLHTFDCSEVTLTCKAIFHLVSLPNLCKVDIHIRSGQIDIIPSLHSSFPAVQHLTLNCNTVVLAIEFVRHLIWSVSLTLGT